MSDTNFRMTPIFLFLLPFTWFAGVALQAAGFYLAALFVPLFYFLHQTDAFEKMKPLLRSVATSLFIFWAVYPLSSIVSVVIDKSVPVPPLKMLLSSEMSSAFLGASVVLWFVTLLKPLQAYTKISEEKFVNSFYTGLLASSITWWAFLFFQHLTGWDVHGPTHLLDSQHMLPNGRFRVFGFYGHPLSIAAVSLHVSLFSFAWAIWGGWTKKQKQELFLISALHLHILFMSGGRTALACEALVLGIFLARKVHTKYLIVIFATIGAVVWKMHILERYFEVIHQYQQTGILPDRVHFWKVHRQLFIESPIFGTGWATVDWVRENMYFKLGLGMMRDHFNAHNTYLEILTLTGIVGFALTLWAARNLCRTVFNRASTLEKVFLFALIGNVLHGFTQNVFQDSNVSYCLLGFLMVLIWIRSLQEDLRSKN